MHSIVSKSGVTLDARLFGKNVVVLALQMTYDLGETAVYILAEGSLCLSGQACTPGLIIDLVSKAGGVDNRKRYTCAFLI